MRTMSEGLRAGAAAAAAGAVALAAAACGGEDPYADGGGGGASGVITVGSADFPESALLAEIYAQALEAAGSEVETKLNIGSREVYYDQVESGAISVLPEYNGGILLYLDPEAESGSTEETSARAAEELPEGLSILDASPAENKDSVTVTKETADEEGLTEIGDLKDVAGDMEIGGPPEFETRPQGLPGLKEVYGVEFGGFSSLDPALVPTALSDGDVQAANLFTTDPAIASEGFVTLEDPENLFGAQNVVPLIHDASVPREAREVLNRVSAELTTEDLVKMNERVGVEHESADAVAADWLAEAGLD
ncbi:ABC transporter substrate-binding protein [Nocardiopsis sp. RSe5-2]|uniref:ABC transporter substrate-binding protein n=1 Tax=Nocardiopsis endophytica TaxID=3018445 RepID=A0ABT4U439_9ACTN|nr:ABC transporter substrate-binding protein [Nocardiopsis endophytica]MDA2811476.1 ABC transporter substrate-binding protein [Nocardiopsis endophytica]